MASFFDTTGGAAAISAGGGILQGLLNAGFAKKNAALNYKYNSMLMSKQNQYNIDAFNRENARQDFLMRNANSIMKQSLQNAGYSTADPNGTGVTPAGTNNMDVPSNPGMSVNMSPPDLAGIFQTIASTKLMEAQANKANAETEMQYILNDLKKRFGESEVITNLSHLGSEMFSNIANAMKADQDRLNSVKITDATVKNIENRLEMDWMKLQPELQVMCQQLENLKLDGKIKEAEEKQVYQLIKESNSRIARLAKENQLTDADIAVAKASQKLIDQQKRTEGHRTRSAAASADEARIEADAKKALGKKYYAAKEVVDEVTKTGERIGNVVSSFIPFTDKVETSTSSEGYDRFGRSTGGSKTTQTRTTTRKR